MLNAFWFVTGMLTMFAALVVTLPWLRTIPRFASLPAVPWQAPLISLLVIGAALVMYAWLGRPDLISRMPVTARQDSTLPESNARSMTASPAAGGANAAAGSMSAAIDSLRARLRKGGGSDDEWELLAKSYEFLGMPDDARQARAHQLPAAADVQAPATGASISGEVSIAATLSGKAAPGATLFIVAKSADLPGPPVAVFRGSVGAWPVKFTLDDSSSMLPGRNLSNAKHVTVEARISRSGQALPAAGDLRGMTGVIDPSSPQPMKIVINEVLP